MVLPLALHAQSIEESLDPGKMYIFNKSAKLEAYYEGEAWSMRFSGKDSTGAVSDHPVSFFMEGGTFADTSYFEISDIDSIVMFQPEPVMQPGVFELTYDYFEFIEHAEFNDSTRIISFYKEVKNLPLPVAGQKIVCNIFEEPLPVGMMGRVESVTEKDGLIQLVAWRDYDSLRDFYKLLVYEGVGEDPAMTPSEKRALAKRVVAPGLAKRRQAPWHKSSISQDVAENLFVKTLSAGSSVSLSKGDVTVDLKIRGSYKVQVDYRCSLFAKDDMPATNSDGDPNAPVTPIIDNEDLCGAKIFYTTKSEDFGIELKGNFSHDIGWNTPVGPLHIETIPEKIAPGECGFAAHFGIYTGFGGAVQLNVPFGSFHTRRTLGVNLANTLDGSVMINDYTSDEGVKTGLSWSLTLSAYVIPVKLDGGFTARFAGRARPKKEISLNAYFAPIVIEGTIGIGSTSEEIINLDQLNENYQHVATGSISARICAIHADGSLKIGGDYFKVADIGGTFDAQLATLKATGYPSIESKYSFNNSSNIYERIRQTPNRVETNNPAGTASFRQCDAGNLFHDLQKVDSDEELVFSNRVDIPSWLFFNKSYELNNVPLVKGHCYQLYPILYKDDIMMSPCSSTTAERLRVPCDIKEAKVKCSWEYVDFESQTNTHIYAERSKLNPKVGVIYSLDETKIKNLTSVEARHLPTDIIKKEGTLSENGKIEASISIEAVKKDYYFRIYVQLNDTDFVFGQKQYFQSLDLRAPVTLPDPSLVDYQRAIVTALVNPELYNASTNGIVFGMRLAEPGNPGPTTSDFYNEGIYENNFNLNRVASDGLYAFQFTYFEPDTRYSFRAMIKDKNYMYGDEVFWATDTYEFRTKNPFEVTTKAPTAEDIEFYEAHLEGAFKDENVKYFVGSDPQHKTLKRVFAEVISEFDDFPEDKLFAGSLRIEDSDLSTAVEDGTISCYATNLMQNTNYKFRIVAETSKGGYYFGRPEFFKTKNVYESKMVSAVTDKQTDVTTFKATVSQPLLDQIKAGSDHKIRFEYWHDNVWKHTELITPSSTNVVYKVPERLEYAQNFNVRVVVVPAGMDPDDFTAQVNGWLVYSNVVNFSTPHPYRMTVPFFADLTDYQDGFTLQFQPSEECERRRLEEGQDIEFLFYLWEDHDAPHSVIDPTQDDMKDAVKELYPDSYSDSQHLGFLTYMACYPLQWYGLQPVVRVNGVSYPSEKKDIIYFKNDNPDNWVVKLLPAEATDVDVTLHGQMSPAIKAILDDTAYEYSHLGKPNLRFQYRNAFDFDDESSWTDVPVKEVPGPVQEGKPVDFYTTLSMKDGLVPLEVYYYRVILDFEGRTNKPYYHNQNPDAIETFKVDPFKIMNLKATADPYDGTHFTVSAEIGEAGHQMLKTDGQSHFYYFECSEDPEFSDIAAFTGYKDLKDSRMMSGEFDYVDIMTTYYVRCVITGGADGSEDQFIVSDSECKVTTSDIDPGLIIGKPEKGSKPVKKKAVK